MRLAILATAALLTNAIGAQGADLPEMQFRPYVPPAFNWTGFYVGANVGGSRAQHGWTDSVFSLRSNNSSRNGFVGGGQTGANYQMGLVVIGAELDFDYAARKGDNDTTVFVPAVGANIVATSGDRWISTLTARTGLAFDRVLVYGKAGGGWVNSTGFKVTNVATGESIANSNHAKGWLVGGGIEWAFGSYINSWTIRLEYTYLGLNNWSYTVPATAPLLAGDTFTASDRNIQMVKLGVNFLFNQPASSRYY